MNAYELADYVADNGYIGTGTTHEVSIMLRQQADRIAELEKYVGFKESGYDIIQLTPQTKPLSDEVLNKAFDYYCETDEGVLRFNYELRDEWKKEQLIRWKEALKKASEK